VTESDHLKPLPKRVAAGSAVFIVGLGVTVLVGWFFHEPALIQFVPQLPPMTRNASVCFLLCGVALLMVALQRSRWLVIVCTGIVSIVSVLTIVEYVFRVNAGIDELLGPSYITVKLSTPGRMAPVSAICFAMGSIGLLLAPKILSRRVALLLGLNGSIIAAVGMATSMAFALGSSDAFGWGNLTRVSLHTAVGFSVLGFGILALAWHVEMDPTGTPRWLPISVGIAVGTSTVGLWQALIAGGNAPFALLPAVVLGGGCLMAPIFGLTVYLAQRAQAQAGALRVRTQELEQRNTQLAEAKALLAEEKLALERSEAYLAEAQRLSHTGSWHWNVGSGEVVWSQEFFAIFGFDPDKTKPSYSLSLERIHPEDRPTVEQIRRVAIREKRDFEVEYRLLIPGGSMKYVHSIGQCLVSQSGDTEYIGAVMDITERKKAGEALRASEQVARGQVEALVQSLDVLATAPAPDQFILRMLSTMGRLLGSQWVAVWLWLVDDATHSLVLRAAVRQDNSDPHASEHPFVKDPLFWKEDGGLQELFFSGVPIAYEDVDTDPRIRDALRAYFQSQGMRKILRLPMRVGGEVKGFITICHARRPPYQPAEVELAQALAHQAMLAIQSRQAATLEERNRMARDVHDTLAQGFTGIVVQLQAAEDASAKALKKDAQKHLQSARDLARQSLVEARRSVHALRPQALEDASFWDALKRMIRQSTAGTALHTKFQMRGHPRDLPPLWQQNLLRIGQETLTNTLKYARAGRFEARLNFNKKELRLELEDDGEGFTTTDRHDGFGLIGMRERVAQMGGTLTVTSAPDHGTKIVVVSRYACNDTL
jgi:PAS domain S-box-containing protein